MATEPISYSTSWIEGTPTDAMAIINENVTITGDGEHSVEWRYLKDDIESEGEDAAWVAGCNWASIELVNGIPAVTWAPNLNTNGTVRTYTIWSSTNLVDGIWMCPTNSGHRFFKVTVEMP